MPVTEALLYGGSGLLLGYLVGWWALHVRLAPRMVMADAIITGLEKRIVELRDRNVELMARNVEHEAVNEQMRQQLQSEIQRVGELLGQIPEDTP